MITAFLYAYQGLKFYIAVMEFFECTMYNSNFIIQQCTASTTLADNGYELDIILGDFRANLLEETFLQFLGQSWQFHGNKIWQPWLVFQIYR